MSRRWKETSFLSTSRTGLKVPVDVALEESYGKLHRSIGDLRPSRSQGSRNHYHPRTMKDDNVPYASSMDVIPGSTVSKTEISMTECEEISILEGNQVIPIASFQRDFVMAKGDNIRRAESLSTFTSAGIARNANSTEVSYASGWQKQRVVKNSESESSMVAMRASSSSSHVLYQQGDNGYTMPAYGRPNQEDIVQRSYSGQDIYENTMGTQDAYGYEAYPRNDRTRAPQGTYRFEDYPTDHIYDEIRASDVTSQQRVQNYGSYSHEDLYENLRKPVIISERLKGDQGEREINPEDCIYENVRSSNIPKQEKELSFSEEDLGNSQRTHSDNNRMMQAISDAKSTPNLSGFSKTDHDFTDSVLGRGNKVKGSEGNIPKTVEPKRDDTDGEAIKEKTPKLTNKRPYLETNLDDILWLPTPTKTEPKSEPIEKSSKAADENQRKFSPSHDGRKSRTSNMSIKRPSCPPPPPPKTVVETEDSLVPEVPAVDLTPYTELSPSLTPDPAENTLNLAFISSEDSSLAQDHDDMSIHASQDIPVDYYPDEKDHVESSEPYSSFEKEDEMDNEELRESEQEHERTIEEGKEPENIQNQRLMQEDMRTERIEQEDTNADVQESEGINIKVQEQKDTSLEEQEQMSTKSDEADEARLVNQVHKYYGIETETETLSSTEALEVGPSLEESTIKQIDDHDYTTEPVTEQQLPDFITIEEKENESPPPYAPPPPPPESDSSETLSAGSVDLPFSDMEGTLSPSPPPRPPSPVSYTGVTSTSPLYYYTSHVSVIDNYLDSHLSPSSPSPSQEESASVSLSHSSDQLDPRRSPSPPPIPPRPKNIEKPLFYRSLPELDLGRHIYENVKFLHDESNDASGYRDFDHESIYSNVETRQTYNEDVIRDEEDRYESFYEDMLHPELQIDDIDRHEGHEVYTDECIYENITRPTVSIVNLSDLEKHTEEDIYANVENSQIYSRITGTSRGDLSEGQTATRVLSSPKEEDSDRYETIQGHTYATIDKSRDKGVDTPAFKGNSRDHTYDSISTSLIHSDDGDEYDEYYPGRRYLLMNKSQIHQGDQDDKEKCYSEHTYATVNKSGKKSKGNVSGNDGSFLDHTYSVIDKSQSRKEEEPIYEDYDRDEIYENTSSILAYTRNMQELGEEHPEEESIYENLNFLRQRLHDARQSQRALPPDQPADEDDHAIYSSLIPTSSGTFSSDSLSHLRQGRSETASVRPPTPPPRHRPPPEGIPLPPVYSPPSPPTPPPPDSHEAQEAEYSSFVNHNNAVRGYLETANEARERDGSFDYQREVQQLLFIQKQRHRRRKQLRQQQPQEHYESGSRAMMEFYVNTLTSDSDSDNDSSTASSSTSASGGSHDLEEEEHVLERTYQVMGCADTVLDTIEEDVEEDSGAESSGHWMFSADSTDTDSVIHVPAILDLRPYPVEAVKEAESTDSDSTLIVEEEEDVNGVCCTEVAKGNSSSSEQEAGVTEGNSHVGAPATDHHHHFEASASDEADEDSDSRGVDTVVLAGGSSSNFRAKTRRRREGDNSRRKKNLPLGDAVRRGLPRQANMLSRNEAAKLFEKHIDDVFDFESLESCESVYGGNDDTSYPSQGCTSPLAGEEVVFNTSATSQPFADASRGMEADPINSERIGEDVVDFSKDAGEFIVNQRVELHSKDGEGSLPLPQAPTSHDITPLATIHDPHAHGEIHYDSESSEFDLNKSANSENTLLDQTYIIGNSECQYEKENTISNVCETPVSSHTPVTNLSESALTSVNVLMDSKMTENDCDENQIPTAVRASEGLAFTHQSSEPISMDLFGLPVRWTEGEKKKSPAFLNSDDIEIPVAPYACKIQKICKTNLEPLTNNDSLDRNNDDVDNFKYDDMKTHNDMKLNNDYNQELARVTKASLKDDSDHDVCENEKVTATERVAVSEGDFTFTSSSPSSSSSSSSTLAVSETSGEAHHYQATTGNLLQSSACHRELSVFPSVAGDGEGASRCITEPLRSENQDDSDRETITMRDHSTSDSKTLESHKNYPSTLTTDNANEPQQPIGVEPQYVKTQRHIENFSSRYYEGEIKNDGTICQQHPSLILQGGDVRQYGTDLPSGNSDTDTDNTDGDYDEEDHFAAELSLRISTVHSEGHSGVGSGGSECRSFRNTDILSVLTATGGKEGAGHEDATGSVSPLASQEGSSPEMPDSLRSSEGRSGTRSIETLSEDSGLGDRDVRLTPSSPLPSISEGGTRGAPSSSQGSQQSLSAVTARPRRQDIRQARIARARSCSDLRVYSDSSDTDTEEENDMHGWHSRSRGGGTVASNINGTAYNGGTYASKPFKSSYANYLQEQYRGEGENVHERHFDNLHPTSPPSRYQHLQRSHPLSGSDGSDEEIKSRYRRVRETSANNYSRPRRYKSLLEFPSKEDYYNASQNSGSDFYKDTQRVPRGVGSAQPRGSRRRREPLSVDLAEEFLSQELQTSKSKHDDKRNGDAIRVSGDKLPGDRGPPSASSRGGAGDEASYHMSVTNQIARSELKTNGVEVGGVLRGPQGSWGEEGLAGCKDEGRADVRVQCGWPHASTTAAAVATAPTAPYPHHHPLDAHHQPPSPPHLTPSSSQRQPQHQYSSSSPAQLPNECQPVRTGHSGNTAPPHDPFAQSDPSTNLPQQEEQEQPFVVTRKATSNDPIQTVQEDNNMAEVPVRVRTKTYGSHGEVEVYLARADSGRPPPHPAASASSPVLTPTGGVEHRTGSRGVTFSPSVKEVNWRESYYEVDPEGDDVIHPTKSTSEVESSRKTPNRVETGDVMQQQEETRPFPIAAMHPNNNTTTGKINGSSFDPSTGSSSEAELGEEKGQQQKSSTPIWQRFKLPKISSPKSPRPKILPKPTSLSPRSSDTEISNPMSPDSSSSTPSSPDSKLKKTPQSPKFFSWGSKREKKPREITRPTTAPPPVPPQPPQVSAGQGGGGGGSRGGQTGEPDSPSVTLTALNREGRGDAPLIISAKKNQVITSDSSEDRVVRSALAKRHVHKSVPSTLTTSASSSNNSGKEEEEELDRRSQSVSSSGDDTADTRGSSSSSSPRSAVAKPPLPPHLQRPTQQAFHKARLLSARRHYFSQERQVSSSDRVSPPKDNTTDAQDGPSVAHPAAHTRSAVTSAETVTPTLSSFRASPPRAKPSLLTKGSFDSSKNLKERFERFSASTRAERERLARSTPDLSVIRASVRRPGQRIDSCTRGGADEQQQQATSAAADIHVAASPASASDGEASNRTNAHQGATHTQSKPRQAIHERYKNRAQRIYARSRTQSTGVLETDLDTGASRELLTLRETNLDDLYKDLQHLLNTLPSVGGPTPTETKARAKSLLDLEAASSDMEGQLEPPTRPPDTRAKSMEFLLDDGNKAAVQPPENELMKGSERQLSEAELRVRRSLQRLDVPEWMKNAQPQQQGFLLRRRDYGSSSMTGGGGGWSAFSSKTASMTSLGSSRAHTPNTPTKVVIPTRVASKGTTGLGGLTSPASNASISPSPSDRSGSLFQYPSSRWSTSRLNSGTTTPTGSVTSTRTTPATYVRQPYLGWRSQTSLASLAGSQSSLTNTGTYLTAADRLALGITSYSQRFVKPPPVSAQDKENSSAQANAAVTKSGNEEMNDEASTNGNIKLQVPTDVADVHSSIKEVTSAIVHYCNESTPSPRASPRGSPRPEGPRAPSPRRLVWVESSFVGSRPITSPETPTSSTHAITPTSQLNGHEEPESNEAPSQPPQPPGEYLLAW